MDFGFQDIPGLLTPQMSDNIRNQMMLGAAIGLIKGGGPSPTPNFFGAFGDGLQGALTGRKDAQDAAWKELLQSEQIRKLAEDRQQREAWQKIFGGANPASAPVPQPQGMPQGVMSPPNAPPIAQPQQPPVAPGPTTTPAGVRADANVSLGQVLRNMPPAMRQMIGLMGPTKGMDAMSTYIGKKFDKPSDTFLTLQAPDGTTTNLRADDPRVDAAVAAGEKVVSMPSGTPSNTFITAQAPDGSFKSYRADDPALDKVIAAGAKVVTTPSSNPKDTIKKPDNYLLPDGTTVLSDDGKTYIDANGQKQPIPQAGAIKLGADTAYESSRAAKVQQRAEKELAASPSNTAPPPAAEGPAAQGTGPWSAAWAAADAVAGGAGLDTAFGRNGIFPETTANRQYLRNLRQVAKTALVNNPRFPVAEQKNADELFPDPDSFWTNPNAEAQKVPILRNTLQGNLDANNAALASGGLTKEEQSRLTSNNIEIRRAQRMLGDGDASLGALDGKTPAKAAAPAATGWAAVPVNGVVVQNGRRYQKGADGKAVDIGAAQ